MIIKYYKFKDMFNIILFKIFYNMTFRSIISKIVIYIYKFYCIKLQTNMLSFNKINKK